MRRAGWTHGKNRKPMKPRKSWIKPAGRIKPKKRKPSEFARIYGSKGRVEWVKSLECCACGDDGYSENAHVGTEGKGAGLKANADQIAPLCGPHYTPRYSIVSRYPGCHRLFDEYKAPFDTEAIREAVIAQAALVAAAWDARECAA